MIRFVDLFAGTGSVGIEALSRGAKFVRFIDKNSQAIVTVRNNLKITGFLESAEILQHDALLELSRDPNLNFDYVYIAPPQYKQIWEHALLMIDSEPSCLAPDAWVIAQIHPVEYVRLNPKNIFEFDRRKYGSTLPVFFERESMSSANS